MRLKTPLYLFLMAAGVLVQAVALVFYLPYTVPLKIDPQVMYYTLLGLALALFLAGAVEWRFVNLLKAVEKLSSSAAPRTPEPVPAQQADQVPGSPDSDLHRELLVAQYVNVSNDKRYYDQAMWEIPSVAMAVSTGVFAVGFTYVHPYFMSRVVLLFGAFFDFTLTIALTKHRLSIDARTAFLQRFETKFGLEDYPVETHRIQRYLGNEYPHATHPLFRNLIAFKWMFRTMVLLVGIMVATGIGLIIYQFV